VRTANADPAEDRVLRAKYLDWCSARVAERFVKLTPEEIYELAHRAAPGLQIERTERRQDASLPSATAEAAHSAFSFEHERSGESTTYSEVIERVTRALTNELALPPFDDWAVAYRAAPERFDDELLGFWRENL
jgi:hypothetical protein